LNQRSRAPSPVFRQKAHRPPTQDAWILVQRAGEPGADQVFELFLAEEIPDLSAATLFADAGMKDRDRSPVNLAANALRAGALMDSWL
jgi:hypothetical protein